MSDSAQDLPLQRLRRLVAALQQPQRLGHEVEPLRLVETHISLVLLAGRYAYKFKKPVDLGFADFTGLEQRRHYCQEELRLNRRLAPALYLDLVVIGGTVDAPSVGAAPAIEYAVKMSRFPREAELDRAVAAGAVGADAFAGLGRRVARFHDSVPAAPPDSRFGSPAQLRRHCDDNLDAMEGGLPGLDPAPALARLRDWTRAELARLHGLLEQRRRDGRVRECHGDMHLTNMVWLDGQIEVFDCIEFNADLRWSDVGSELAFLLMDLDHRARSDLGRVFLDAWLQHTGDYGVLALLPLLRVYRSLVRAKVACLRGRQGDDEALLEARARMDSHLQLALRYVAPPPSPVLVITRGLSGSGKTTVTDALLPTSRDAVRVRSDVERKRLHGMSPDRPAGSAPGTGLYTAAHTARTYGQLERIAQVILSAGFPAIVDATFLDRERRVAFAALARSMGCRFAILDCTAPPEVLRERVRARGGRGDASDAGTAVLDTQLAGLEPLGDDERAVTVTVDTRRPVDAADLAARLGIAATPRPR